MEAIKIPRLKIDDDDIDVDELENAEYEDRDFETYSGEQPPKGTVLRGLVSKMWWTYTRDEDAMLKVLWIADGNTGDEEEYDGLPVWINLALTAKVKFRWQPFFEQFGLSIRLVKTKLYVGSEDDEKMGSPIEKIGTWVPGSDEARCRIITGREKYGTNWQTRVDTWLDDEEAEDEDEELEDEELEDEELEDEELEDEEEEDEEDDEEEPPPPPARRKAAAASTTKTSAPKTAAARPSARSAPAKAARTGTAARTPAKAASTAKPTAKGRRAKSSEVDDEPPF